MKRFQYLLGAFIFLVVGVLVGWGIPRASSVPPLVDAALPAVSAKASVMFDEGDGNVKVFEKEPFVISNGETVFDLTKRIAEREKMNFVYDPPGKYGILIKEIDGHKNGNGGAYWLYWVNNHAGEVGADQYKLKSGDVIEWKFINMKF